LDQDVLAKQGSMGLTLDRAKCVAVVFLIRVELVKKIPYQGIALDGK
jgi:hypothetical protein